MTMKSQVTYILLLQRVKISVTPLYRYKRPEFFGEFCISNFDSQDFSRS